jgi:hypothetical protein
MVSAATKKKTKNGSRMYRYYACKRNLKSGKEACPGYRWQVEPLEKAVIGPVLDWIFSEENVKALVKEVRKVLLEREKPAKALRKDIADVEQGLARYYTAFEEGALDPADMADRVKELKRTQKGLEAELAKRTSIQQLPAHYSRPEYIESVRQELRGIFENGSHQLKTRYLNILLEEIVVDGDKVHVKPKGEGIIASLENSGRNGDGGVGKVISLSDKWQPVGDSNPCDRTENPAS